MIRFSLLTSVFAACAMTACDIQSKTDHISDTSDQLKNQTQHVAKRTDDIERESVGAVSDTTVMDYLDVIFGEGKYVNQTITEPLLLLDAGFMVEAMHFQYWKGDYNDDIAALDDDFTQALEILFVHATSHIPRTFDVNILVPDRNWKAIGSIGAKLDRESQDYSDGLAAAGLSQLSAFDVMIKALKDQGTLQRTELLPKATSMVLQWKQDAIYILQMRQIYLPLTVLGRMTDFQDQKTVAAWNFWDTRAWDALGQGLTVNLGQQGTTNTIDPEELKVWTSWLNQALATRQALKDICIEPLYNNFASKILGKVRLVPGNLVQVTGAVQVQKDFIEAYGKVIAQTTTASPGVVCTSQ